MIICKQCFKGDEPRKEAEFDYWQWFDSTEDFMTHMDTVVIYVEKSLKTEKQ